MSNKLEELKQIFIEKKEETEWDIEVKNNTKGSKEEISKLDGKRIAFNFCIKKIEEFLEEEKINEEI